MMGLGSGKSWRGRKGGGETPTKRLLAVGEKLHGKNLERPETEKEAPEDTLQMTRTGQT